MSRRIAYVFAIAGCAAFVAPASADRECFDNICRMPEVIEAPDAAEQPEQPNVDAVPPAVAERRSPSPLPIVPQMAVDALPRPGLEPLARRSGDLASFRSAAPAPAPRQGVRQLSAPAGEPSRAVEVVNQSPSYSVEQSTYAANALPSQRGSGVIVVVPVVQYGQDGVALLQGRQDSSWQLCQSDRRDRNAGQCGPYSYQPYGAHGYRPYGSYRQYRSAPAYVYVPNARIVTIDGNN